MTIKELKECFDAKRQIYHSPTRLLIKVILFETYSNIMDNVLVQREGSSTEVRIQLDDLLVL